MEVITLSIGRNAGFVAQHYWNIEAFPSTVQRYTNNTDPGILFHSKQNELVPRTIFVGFKSDFGPTPWSEMFLGPPPNSGHGNSTGADIIDKQKSLHLFHQYLADRSAPDAKRIYTEVGTDLYGVWTNALKKKTDISEIDDVRVDFFANPPGTAGAGSAPVDRYFSDFAEHNIDTRVSLPDWCVDASVLSTCSEFYGRVDIDCLLEEARLQLEKCNCLDGLQVITSSGAGWSRYTSDILTELSQEVPKTSMLVYDIDAFSQEHFGGGAKTIPEMQRRTVYTSNSAVFGHALSDITTSAAWIPISTDLLSERSVGLGNARFGQIQCPTSLCDSLYANAALAATAISSYTQAARHEGYALSSLVRGLCIAPLNNILAPSFGFLEQPSYSNNKLVLQDRYNEALAEQKHDSLERAPPVCMETLLPVQAGQFHALNYEIHDVASAKPLTPQEEYARNLVDHETRECFALLRSVGTKACRAQNSSSINPYIVAYTDLHRTPRCRYERALSVHGCKMPLPLSYPHMFRPYEGVTFRTEIGTVSELRSTPYLRPYISGLMQAVGRAHRSFTAAGFSALQSTEDADEVLQYLKTVYDIYKPSFPLSRLELSDSATSEDF